ncbi:DUF1294 domain-containing protein [Lentibacillus sediminis]|uniref:DUF1294 domain-containing protein n=1 Tax=Lentibacillus sediminis TaxID=1940529 RepID=UPI000C1C7C92|nr:DUF1294 domain-containing protein [Lentibacillus sediminis]
MNEWDTILFYIVGVNAITFYLMARDKSKAKKQEYRIPERTFWLLGVLGGAAGCYLGMRVFRHKTKHRSFMIGMPLILMIQLIGLVFFFLS